ncbi:MAG: HPr family phosphocarrier protein [Peptostreptococcaceae bacterium]|nr:HPr family phosphocarrier protein [Peptostreptococcaceae bacterium]
MLKRELIVQNKTGLHARPASEFVKKASTFRSSVFIEFGEKNINAKSIVGLLSAGIGYGSRLVLAVEGEDENEAMEALAALISEKFAE